MRLTFFLAALWFVAGAPCVSGQIIAPLSMEKAFKKLELTSSGAMRVYTTEKRPFHTEGIHDTFELAFSWNEGHLFFRLQSEGATWYYADSVLCEVDLEANNVKTRRVSHQEIWLAFGDKVFSPIVSRGFGIKKWLANPKTRFSTCMSPTSGFDLSLRNSAPLLPDTAISDLRITYHIDSNSTITSFTQRFSVFGDSAIKEARIDHYFLHEFPDSNLEQRLRVLGTFWKDFPDAPRTPLRLSAFDSLEFISPATATSISGVKIPLPDTASQYTLIAFWFTACPGCQKEFSYLNSLPLRFRKGQLTTVGLNPIDPATTIQRVISAQHLDYEQIQAIPSFDERQVEIYPSLLLLNRKGRVIFRGIGSSDTVQNQLDSLLKASDQDR